MVIDGLQLFLSWTPVGSTPGLPMENPSECDEPGRVKRFHGVLPTVKLFADKNGAVPADPT